MDGKTFAQAIMGILKQNPTTDPLYPTALNNGRSVPNEDYEQQLYDTSKEFPEPAGTVNARAVYDPMISKLLQEFSRNLQKEMLGYRK